MRRRSFLHLGSSALLACCCGVSGCRQSAHRRPMVTVPGGTAWIGTERERARAWSAEYGYHLSWFEPEFPRRREQVEAFLIDRHPVTNGDYLAYCREVGAAPPEHWHGEEPAELLWNHPVTHVSQEDARAFARWSGRRLPTEIEWEKAARGDDGRIYPWGERFDPEACNWRGSPGFPRTTSPVSAHPTGASPYGVLDMVGNVAEWCEDERSAEASVVRGGCWQSSDAIRLRAASRMMSSWSRNRLSIYGFRCARDIES